MVTGAGIVSAIGVGTDETLQSLKNLKSGIGSLSVLKSKLTDIPVAEVGLRNSELAELTGIYADDISRNTLLAMVAARFAVRASGYPKLLPAETGLILATTSGGMDLNEQYYKSLLESNRYKHLIPAFDSADATEQLAVHFGIQHHVTTISTACSSSANAIMLGARLIKSGRVKRVLAGGTDALTKFTLNGFNALEILSLTGCMPFDANRNGLTIGEGAAMLMLESEDTAEPGNILCEVTGFANVNEAFHATASSSDGFGASLAMEKALQQALLNPSDISYINAHGTGTAINDLSEGNAMRKIFGDHLPPVSSTKSFTGHTLGAAGAVEAVFSALAIQKQVLIPQTGFSIPMPEVNIVPVKELQPYTINHVISNSFGFGGNNTALIFSKA